MRKRKSSEFHGMSGTRIYGVWDSMRARCQAEDHVHFKNYGERGISVCEEWDNSFSKFYEDMIDGYGPGLEIDRIDNDLGYFKENCRWVTRKKNASNKRNFGTYMKGVSRKKDAKSYVARIEIEGIPIRLGSFKSELLAHEAYSLIHKEWYGS